MAEEKDYSSKWIVSEMHALGAGWYVQVGIIEDSQGKRKVRVARGRANPQGGIIQSQKINLKPKEWPWLREQLDRFIAQMQQDAAQDADAPGEAEQTQ
jgi:hypothetical protein